MKFKFLGVFLGVFKRMFSWLGNKGKQPKKRPHSYSKNAWSYISRGRPTPAKAIMCGFCR